MKTTDLLVLSGYNIATTSAIPNQISFAVEQETGKGFLFSVRLKSEPTLRQVTGFWEFGVDVPDFERYKTSHEINNKHPFYVFFETPREVRYCTLETVEKGRKFFNEVHFPNGIIFVKLVDTHDIKVLIEKKQTDQLLLQGFTLNDEKSPKQRIRKLEERRRHIFDQVVMLLDQAAIMQHEIDQIEKIQNQHV